MRPAISFNDRINRNLARLSPAARRVVHFIQDNREAALVAPASSIADQTGTSDATVIRTIKSLGFSGMSEFRRSLAGELRENLSLASRLESTLETVGDDLAEAFNSTLDIHRQALENLRRDIGTASFRAAVERLAAAERIAIFGIGPSSAMANYLRIQLGRFGIEAYCLTNSGLLLADDLQKLRRGDMLVIFAYSRVYRELATLLREADRRHVGRLLITDSLGGQLHPSVDLVLGVARGKTGMLSMHTATLGLIETLLVGLAAIRPRETLASLRRLNESRAELAGKYMDLPAG